MPKKRGNGEAMYRLRPDGRWEGRVRLGSEGGKPKRVSFYGKTKSDVQRKVEDAKARFNKSLPIIMNAPTLEVFMNAWLTDVIKNKVRPSTYRSYEQITRNHLIPGLGAIRLEKLTPQQITTFLARKHESGISAVHIYRVLRAALGNAMKHDLVSRNVASLAEVPKKPKKPIGYLSEEQAKAFVAALEGTRWEALFILAVVAGLRLGEVLGCRWQDLDTKAGTLTIQNQMQRVKGKLCLVQLKSESARRCLNLPPFVLTALAEHRVRQDQVRAAAEDHWQEHDLIFSSRVGTPADARNITREKDALLEAVGLPPRRFHDLRHTCATLLLSKGVPMRMIMDQLGHSQISLTADTYSHILPAMRKDAAKKMEALFAKKKATNVKASKAVTPQAKTRGAKA